MKFKRAVAAAAVSAFIAAMTATPAAALVLESDNLPANARAGDVQILSAADAPNLNPWNGHSHSAGTPAPIQNALN